MNSRREYRNNRAALFDGIEEGGLRASSPYASREIYEDENERALDSLHDRVNVLKRLTGDIHEEAESHNRILDGVGSAMDASRGVLSGTMDRFKMVFEKKSSRRMCTLVASLVALFLLIYYLTKNPFMNMNGYQQTPQGNTFSNAVREIRTYISPVHVRY